MSELKPCEKCNEIPQIHYACGEYFIVGTAGCECDRFTEMHSSKEQEIEVWNRRVSE